MTIVQDYLTPILSALRSERTFPLTWSQAQPNASIYLRIDENERVWGFDETSEDVWAGEPIRDLGFAWICVLLSDNDFQPKGKKASLVTRSDAARGVVTVPYSTTLPLGESRELHLHP